MSKVARNALPSTSNKHPHPGLLLDKYMTWNDKNEPQRTDLVKMIISKQSSSTTLYNKFFSGWEDNLNKASIAVKEAKTSGRMIVGMGNEAVLENSVTLHRTYGVPYIPGSALKGLTAHYARKFLSPEQHKEVFGDTTLSGLIHFFDALPKDFKLHQEIMTPHHQDYYSGKKENNQLLPPADWDDPIPISWISVSGTFLLALQGPNNWLDVVWKLLEMALKSEGVGAKTSSGYGRMNIVPIGVN